MGLLKNDPDAGVRKVVLQSASNLKSSRLAATVQVIADTDPEPAIRDLAARAVKNMRKTKS